MWSQAKVKVPELLMLLLNILLHIAGAKSQTTDCFNSETFAENSIYQANLHTLISSLSSNIGSSGFLSLSVGQSPDRVNAVVLCRGDASLAACRECIDATAPELPRRCAYNKDAIFWNETCSIRYSSQPIHGKLRTDPVSPNTRPSIVSNTKRRRRSLRALLESLKGYAANGGSIKKVAAGNRSADDFRTIFALEQCTPDLSVEDCTKCLTESINDVSTCCSETTGARIFRPSCTLGFEEFDYYDASMVQIVQQGPLPPEKDSNRTAITVGVSVAVFVILFVSIGILLRCRKKRKPKEELESPDEVRTVESLQYNFGKVKVATNDFSDDNKLGQGGFGAVYRGKFSNGQEIAVKRLSADSGQGQIEFKNEVLLVARLQHRNLVRLLGFSLEGKERLLVYEFVENASLDHFLFDTAKSSVLDWDRRYKIIVGIARGLLYLHEDSRHKIIHRDLKVSNILLDADMNPKIADFGIARLFAQHETHGNTSKIVGTYGYMSPEYVMHGNFSIKSDIFSFGVLVLEIVSGQKNNKVENGEIVDLLNNTWKSWCEGTAASMIDPALGADMSSLQDMLRCIQIGLLCVQENAADRPAMTSVVLMLSRSTPTLPIPSEPGFYTASHFGPEVSIIQDYDSNAYRDSSRNDTSITELYPGR